MKFVSTAKLGMDLGKVSTNLHSVDPFRFECTSSRSKFSWLGYPQDNRLEQCESTMPVSETQLSKMD
jgi:hypothetical protein